jgi:3alpha(or 20beta)-hydroxysteroid dehydrogenase
VTVGPVAVGPVAVGRLAGRRAIITGAAGGMGRATALRFAAEGAEVVLADRDEREGRATADEVTASGGRAGFHRLDVTVEADWAALADAARSAPVDVLVHCAGVGSATGGGRDGVDAYRTLQDVNALGTLLALRTGVDLMRGRGGSIVTIASVTAPRTVSSDELNVGYAASKAAVRSLTRAYAASAGRDGIRVNCILPGFMPPMRGSRMPEGPGGESPFLPLIPLGRTGTAEDVAAAALFLASDDAAYVTGIDLSVDGGFLV